MAETLTTGADGDNIPASVASKRPLTGRDNGDYITDRSDKEYGRGWPDFFGSCFAGRCTLDQSQPGCCRGHGGGGSLVCWKDEDDVPHLLWGQQT